eukprot:gene16464-22686_t
MSQLDAGTFKGRGFAGAAVSYLVQRSFKVCPPPLFCDADGTTSFRTWMIYFSNYCKLTLGEAGFMENAEIPSAVFEAFLGGDVLAAYKGQQEEAPERVCSLAGFEQAIGSLTVEDVVKGLVNMEHSQSGARQQGSRLGNLNLDLSKLGKDGRQAPLVNMSISQAAAGQRGKLAVRCPDRGELEKVGDYIDGLHSSIQTDVKMQECQTLGVAMQKAVAASSLASGLSQWFNCWTGQSPGPDQVIPDTGGSCPVGFKVLDIGQVVAGNFAGAMLAYFGATVYMVGFKVLDVGQVVAGNFASAMLAYFGATVYMVEQPVGFKVLDVGQVVAGNFAGAMLAYFGATVYKVEPPVKGDPLRTLRMMDSPSTSLWWRCHPLWFDSVYPKLAAVDIGPPRPPMGGTLEEAIVIHRDIKLANILLKPGLEKARTTAVVVDFGLHVKIDIADISHRGGEANSASGQLVKLRRRAPAKADDGSDDDDFGHTKVGSSDHLDMLSLPSRAGSFVERSSPMGSVRGGEKSPMASVRGGVPKSPGSSRGRAHLEWEGGSVRKGVAAGRMSRLAPTSTTQSNRGFASPYASASASASPYASPFCAVVLTSLSPSPSLLPTFTPNSPPASPSPLALPTATSTSTSTLHASSKPATDREAKPTAVSSEPAIDCEAKPAAVSSEPAIDREAKPAAVSSEPAINCEAKPAAVSSEHAIDREAEPTAVSLELAMDLETKPTAVSSEPAMGYEIKPTAVSSEPAMGLGTTPGTNSTFEITLEAKPTGVALEVSGEVSGPAQASTSGADTKATPTAGASEGDGTESQSLANFGATPTAGASEGYRTKAQSLANAGATPTAGASQGYRTKAQSLANFGATPTADSSEGYRTKAQSLANFGATPTAGASEGYRTKAQSLADAGAKPTGVVSEGNGKQPDPMARSEPTKASLFPVPSLYPQAQSLADAGSKPTGVDSEVNGKQPNPTSRSKPTKSSSLRVPSLYPPFARASQSSDGAEPKEAIPVRKSTVNFTAPTQPSFSIFAKTRRKSSKVFANILRMSSSNYTSSVSEEHSSKQGGVDRSGTGISGASLGKISFKSILSSPSSAASLTKGYANRSGEVEDSGGEKRGSFKSLVRAKSFVAHSSPSRMLLSMDRKQDPAGDEVALVDRFASVFQLMRTLLKPSFEEEFHEVFQLTGQTGSLLYMAPEVFRGQPYNELVDVFSFGVLIYKLLVFRGQPYNERVDVFSFGVLIYELFGRKPVATLVGKKFKDAREYAFQVSAGYRPPRVCGIHPQVWGLITSCWNEDPVQRPSMSQVQVILHTLARVLAEEVGANSPSQPGDHHSPVGKALPRAPSSQAKDYQAGEAQVGETRNQLVGIGTRLTRDRRGPSRRDPKPVSWHWHQADTRQARPK